MNDRLKEQLLGYALGALDENEQLEVERLLSVDPALREELEKVQGSLEPLAESYEEFEPPAGLADRACDYVADEVERLDRVQPGSGNLRPTTHAALEAKPGWRMTDWVVSGGICACAILLFFPAVLNSRIMSRMTACQDNLRKLGVSLVQYSEYVGNGYFPTVPLDGKESFAGVFAPRLKECELLEDDRRVICPDSALAHRMDEFRVPSLDEIHTASSPQIWLLQQHAGGSYAYNLGVIVEGHLLPVKNLSRPTFALMADSPVAAWGPAAHGHGRNVLFEDMHISFVVHDPQIHLADDPFMNRFNRCEAGIGANDAVVGPSDCPPIRNKMVLDLTR